MLHLKLHSPSQVVLYGMNYVQGELITVGGCNINGFSSNVSSYNWLDKKWVDKILPMPTGRCTPTVMCTDTAIIVCGGAILDGCLQPAPCRLVEVYNSETSQWHRSAQLPHPYAAAPIAVVGDYLFLIGEATERDGSRKVTYANMKDLIEFSHGGTETTSDDSSSSELQVWKELSECPLIGSAAVCFNGALLTLGGDDISEGGETVNYVHAFVPHTNSWTGLKYGALPEALGGSSAAQLIGNRILIVGGSDPDDENTASVFIGTIA